ncbi:MAG: methyltransferase domain-containing protein [Amphiplicatus sp.]
MSERAAPPKIFDRALVARRRARAAKTFSDFDFLHRRAMADIVDRLESVRRDFPLAHFCGAGSLTSLLTEAAGVGDIVYSDLAPSRLPGETLAAVADEERNPFAPESFDLVVSLLTLHSTNDLVGALAQHRISLKPDGLFIAALFGEETLGALRQALYAAETVLRGGVSPRIAPFASVRDLGGAMQRAGFAMPVADIDPVRINYKDPARLLADLRGMGETGALSARGRGLTVSLVGETLARLNEEIRFDIVYLTGWAPAPGQPKPLKPGSGRHSLDAAINSKT